MNIAESSHKGKRMSDPGSLAVLAILVVPGVAAAWLAVLPDDRTTAWLNVLASLLTFAAALVLLVARPPVGPFLIVDDLNVVFILLSTFIDFTNSSFSRSYIDHE